MRKHITYANVVSTLALFVVLGGGAYAVTGRPDKNGVFHACVSSSGALRMVDGSSSCRKAKRRNGHRIPGETAISWNERGPIGPVGQGTPGQNGQNGATKMTVRRASGAANTNGASVDCLPGERATGGGGTGTSNADPITASWALAGTDIASTGDTPTGWSITSGGTGVHEVWVLCAAP